MLMPKRFLNENNDTMNTHIIFHMLGFLATIAAFYYYQYSLLAPDKSGMFGHPR